MEKVLIMSTPVQNRASKDSQTKPWWNRNLWGDESLIESVNHWLNQTFFTSRAEVSESSMAIYKQSLTQLHNIAAIAKTIDREKFSTQEFILFLDIKRQIDRNLGLYQGLKNTIDLLGVALETKDCFLKIEATETRYRSYSQQDFYNYVFELLGQSSSKDEFKERVHKQLVEVISKVKTEEGKSALQAYCNQLYILSENELGLKLLFLFKQSNLTDFSLLRNIAEIADSFYDKELQSLKQFNFIVRMNAEMFLKFGEIIEVPESQNNPKTYALILQYIALKARHQNSYGQFQQLIQLLKDWQQFYDPIIAIRQEYPPNEYKQPPIFREEIPGLTVYEKYQSYLESSS